MIILLVEVAGLGWLAGVIWTHGIWRRKWSVTTIFVLLEMQHIAAAIFEVFTMQEAVVIGTAFGMLFVAMMLTAES